VRHAFTCELIRPPRSSVHEDGGAGPQDLQVPGLQDGGEVASLERGGSRLQGAAGSLEDQADVRAAALQRIERLARA
jgi:hypothetical protein